MARTKPLLQSLESRDPALQLRRAASSVAANYRIANRAKSHRDFTAKLSTVLEEADEAQYWLELIRDCGWVDRQKLAPTMAEANELVAIFSTAVTTARRRDGRPVRRRGSD